MGMLEQAWQAFESATVQNPRWPRPWANLAWLARRMDKPKAEIDRCTDRFLEKRRENIDRRQALILAARSNRRSHFPHSSALALSEPGRPAAH
jgi:hypothetical protein